MLRRQKILARFVIAVISPLGSALLLGLLALAFCAARKQRSARATASLALAWLLAWSLPAASLSLRARLEADYPAIAAESRPNADAIVVLGGALAPPRHGQLMPDLGAGADRVWEAARLYRAGKAPLLILSGSGDPEESATSEAAAMRRLLLDFGVPAEAMLLEERSRNTAENARFSAEILRARGLSAVLLVTSALHMERARKHFEAADLRVLPAPTDHEASGRLDFRSLNAWLPDAGALAGSASALKELVARAASGLTAGAAGARPPRT